MIAHRWRDALPEIVRYRPRTVAEPGTLFHWDQAIAIVTGDDESAQLLIEDPCDCNRQGCATCFPLSAAKWAARADAVIELNRQALQHFRDGVAVGSYRSPVAPPGIGTNLQFLQGLRNLVRLAKIQAVREADQGQLLDAARTLTEIIDAGKLVIDSEGKVIDYLIGIALVGVGTCAVDELLDRHRLPSGSRDLLATTVEKLDFRQAVANTLRSELNRWTLPTLEHFEQRRQLKGPPAFFEIFAADPVGQHLWREQQLQFLLEDHPRAFDAEDLARGLACSAAVDVAECENVSLDDEDLEFHRSFQQRRKQFQAVWPSEFVQPLYNVSEEAASDEDRATQEFLRKHNESVKPIDHDRLQSTRDALRNMANPLGLAIFDQAAGMGACSLLNFPLMAQSESLRSRLGFLNQPTLISRFREQKRRWQQKKKDRRRLRRTSMPRKELRPGEEF